MAEELLIDTTIKKVEFLLRWAGINIRTGDRNRMTTIKSRFVYILNFIWLNTDLAGAIVWFFVGLSNDRSFTELTYVAPCITLSCLGNLKSMYLIIRENDVYKLINTLRELEADEKRRDQTLESEEMIKDEHNFVTAVISVLNVFYGILVIAFALSPLILVALKYFTTNEVELVLPFLIVYPFDPFDIRYWPFVYLRQIWSEVIVVINICTADYLFYTFCTYIRMQFRLLRHRIERIIPFGDELESKLSDIEEMKRKFVVLIKWHHRLIDSVNILEAVYTRSTLLNFVSSSVLICLTGFNVVAISDIAFVITFLSFLFMSLLQIFFLCFFGDLLMTSSMEVSDAVYNCRWYLADHSFVKYLLIVQIRTQIPCKLTASNFSLVNLKAFMKILSTSWSYFALLQTLYSSPSQ